MNLTENILTTMGRASRDDIVAGASWYTDAHALAGSLSADITVGAGVIAALSPQLSWVVNQRQAIAAFRTGAASGCLGSSCRKADRIMAGEPALSVLGGDKVRNFYDNIVNPHGSSVAIDRHAWSIAMGFRSSNKDRSSLGRKGEYDRFADAYRAAAGRLGISPPTLQAITWVTWRREAGLTWAG